MSDSSLQVAKPVNDEISRDAYEKLCVFLESFSGLTLPRDKDYLAKARLPAVCKQYKFESINQLINEIGSIVHQNLKRDVAEAMATPETFFFRDNTPFDMLKNHVLPEMLPKREGAKQLRFFCAACSSGQEPYSIVMLCNELGLYDQGWNIEIIATDFSLSILEKAKAAQYSHFEVQRGLPMTHLIRYFEKRDNIYIFKEEYRKRVKFNQANLLESLIQYGKFDVVFCRNVLFYFTPAVKKNILDNTVHPIMKPDIPITIEKDLDLV